jgi:hypothetical protein
MLHPTSISSHRPLPETVISRRVKPVRLDEEAHEDRVPEPIAGFREEYAWVLVGDPGSGKSTTFEDEAGQTGGCYLTVADFLDLPPDPSWRNGVLFLDGFDEAQALEGRTTIRELRKRLSELGYPRFRVACRAWDWRDATFREDLGRLAPSGLQVLALEPLQRGEILQILVDNHGIQDAEAFLARVATAGFAGWLGNPLNLELLVKSQREGMGTRRRQTNPCVSLLEKASTYSNSAPSRMLLNATRPSGSVPGPPERINRSRASNSLRRSSSLNRLRAPAPHPLLSCLLGSEPPSVEVFLDRGRADPDSQLGELLRQREAPRLRLPPHMLNEGQPNGGSDLRWSARRRLAWTIL